VSSLREREKPLHACSARNSVPFGTNFGKGFGGHVGSRGYESERQRPIVTEKGGPRVADRTVSFGVSVRASGRHSWVGAFFLGVGA
jgi:hypothetical protein